MPALHSPCAESVGTGAPANEINVTPEMSEAGVNALWATGAIEHPGGADESVVQAVFAAMISASPSLPPTGVDRGDVAHSQSTSSREFQQLLDESRRRVQAGSALRFHPK